MTRLVRVAGGKTVGPLEKNYADVAPVYDQTRYLNRKAQFTSRCETKLLRSILAPFGRSDKVLVDVACGTGHFTLQVAELFGTTVGIDLTSEMLHAARNKSRSIGRTNVCFVQASANALPFAPDTADVVMTTRFLHLFPREQHAGVVEGLLRIVRPGGMLVVEHDGPFPEFVSWIWRVVRRRRKESWSSYGSGAPPSGARCIRDVGVSAPGLPSLALIWPAASQWLSRWFVMAPLRPLATFRVLVYRKPDRSERIRSDVGA